jgi:HlyD family secretion protein
VSASPTGSVKASIRRHLGAGAAVAIFLLGGIGTWASTTDISGAVIGAGNVVVDSSVKKLQHPTGGIVSEVRVRDGDRVREGDILVRLDETLTRANLAIVSKGLDELLARKARLEAERDAADSVTFPDALVARQKEPEVRKLIDGERRLYEIRRMARNGQKLQLGQRIQQLSEEAIGYGAQERAKLREIELISRELEGARELWKKNLMPVTKFTALEREAARLEGERGVLVATQSQTKGKVSEIELQILQLDHDLSSEVARELREVDAKIGEMVERKVAAEDQLKRTELRAPQDGTVHQTTIHTVGGVIAPGEQVMLIVPDADTLKIEAKISPQDVDQLRVGQTAVLRFSAFSQRTTPEINGALSRVSPDTVTDQRTGQTYYTARVAVEADEISRLGSVKLVPGMPVEVFIQTGERKVLSYLVKPLSDQFARAFRER